MPKRNKRYNIIVSHIVQDLYEILAYNEEDAENLIIPLLKEDGLNMPEVDSIWLVPEDGTEGLPEGLELITEEDEEYDDPDKELRPYDEETDGAIEDIGKE